MRELVRRHIASQFTANERLAICNSCEELWDQFKICKVCLCYMPVKTNVQDARCPKGKW